MAKIINLRSRFQSFQHINAVTVGCFFQCRFVAFRGVPLIKSGSVRSRVCSRPHQQTHSLEIPGVAEMAEGSVDLFLQLTGNLWIGFFVLDKGSGCCAHFLTEGLREGNESRKRDAARSIRTASPIRSSMSISSSPVGKEKGRFKRHGDEGKNRADAHKVSPVARC